MVERTACRAAVRRWTCGRWRSLTWRRLLLRRLSSRSVSSRSTSRLKRSSKLKLSMSGVFSWDAPLEYVTDQAGIRPGPADQSLRRPFGMLAMAHGCGFRSTVTGCFG